MLIKNNIKTFGYYLICIIIVCSFNLQGINFSPIIVQGSQINFNNSHIKGINLEVSDFNSLTFFGSVDIELYRLSNFDIAILFNLAIDKLENVSNIDTGFYLQANTNDDLLTTYKIFLVNNSNYILYHQVSIDKDHDISFMLTIDNNKQYVLSWTFTHRFGSITRPIINQLLGASVNNISLVLFNNNITVNFNYTADLDISTGVDYSSFYQTIDQTSEQKNSEPSMEDMIKKTSDEYTSYSNHLPDLSNFCETCDIVIKGDVSFDDYNKILENKNTTVLLSDSRIKFDSPEYFISSCLILNGTIIIESNYNKMEIISNYSCVKVSDYYDVIWQGYDKECYKVNITQDRMLVQLFESGCKSKNGQTSELLIPIITVCIVIGVVILISIIGLMVFRKQLFPNRTKGIGKLDIDKIINNDQEDNGTITKDIKIKQKIKHVEQMINDGDQKVRELNELLDELEN